MNPNVIITCALTGAGDTAAKSPHVPVTPAQIAAAAVEAAKAGATVVHCHVRNPQTGKFSRDPALYAEVMDRIRDSGVDIIVNLTAGMGGDLDIGPGENPMAFGPATDLIGPMARLIHVEQLLPEICTLDCGSLNFGDGNRAYISTPNYLRQGAAICKDLGVKPEFEIFDTGNLWFVKQMIKEGLVLPPPLIQLCMGIAWGVPASTEHLLAMKNFMPEGAVWSSFAISRMQMPWVANSVVNGGNVRVGLEDNLYLSKGVYASNAQLVTKARGIVEAMGARVIGPAEVRERLQIG